MTDKQICDRVLGDGGFWGADFSSSPTYADPHRLTECVNLWRDYASDVGDFVETFPGVRRVASLGGVIYGVFPFCPSGDPAGRAFVLVHADDDLYALPVTPGADEVIPVLVASGVLAERESRAVQTGEALGILDGTHYYLVTFSPSDGTFACEDTRDRYVPVTYDNDEPYAQRNALSGLFEERWTLSDPDGRRAWTPGLVFEVSDPIGRTCLVAGISAPQALVHLPATTVLAGEVYRVTGVKPYAFQNDQRLEVLTSEPGVISLGAYAFNSCPMLREVYLGESLTTVGKSCFAWSERLETLHLPSTLTEIGPYAFYLDTALTTVTYAGDDDDWGLVTVGHHNDPLPSPTCGAAASPLSRSYRLSLHERCSEVRFVKLDGTLLGQTAYVLTPDTVAAAAKTYYQLIAGRYDPYETTVGATLPEGLWEAVDVWYETEGAEGAVDSIVLFARAGRSVEGRTLLCRGALAPADDPGAGPAVIDAASRPAVDVARARLGVMFDGRVFLTGVPGAPGLVFYSERDPGGRNRPDYIGVCNFVQDGNAETENVAMSATSERLLVYKGSVSDGASVCCHTPESTGQALTPRVYPSETGTMGPGCVGCALNFLDDTVFVSPRGLEATILSRVTGERSLCHRSTTVDARLSSEDLSRVRAAEWNGYLLLLVPGGRVYMADSRRTHTAPSGDRGYEWFLLDGIGAWREDTACFAYAGAWPEGVASLWSGQQELRLAEDPDDLPFGSPEAYLSAEADGRIIEGPLRRVYTDGREDETTGVFARTEEGLFLLRATDERIGGRFVPAAYVAAVRDSLWLATAEGDLLVANTDKAETVRLNDGSVRRRIPRGDYHICRHRYLAGAVTAADCAGIPHLTKHTDKRGTVVRTKSMPGGRFCLRVRTDRDDWQTVGYAVEAEADFADTDMSNAGFSTGRQGQVCFREKTRRWVHKQYALYSDGYARPFGFGALTYRCGVAGRIKN